MVSKAGSAGLKASIAGICAGMTAIGKSKNNHIIFLL